MLYLLIFVSLLIVLSIVVFLWLVILCFFDGVMVDVCLDDDVCCNVVVVVFIDVFDGVDEFCFDFEFFVVLFFFVFNVDMR